MKEMMPLENIDPIEVFKDGGLDTLLEKINEEARSHVPDLSTDKGRKAIASMAAKVAKSKTYLDGVGKDLVSEWKAQAKVVDNERKKARDFLDNLKAEVRQPLTDWEQIEKDRVERHENNINEMSEGGAYTIENWLELPLETMKDRLKEIEGEETGSYEEYAERAAEVKEAALSRITKAIDKREEHEAEQAELEKLRLEAAEREQKEREALIAKQAKEQAEKEAEQKAKVEAERAEKEKQEAIESVKAAEQKAIKDKLIAEERAKEVELQAKIEKENAVKAERERIDAERLAEQKAAEKREANTRHKKKINNEAVDSLMASGLDKNMAINVVTAIAKHEIKNVYIAY